MTQPAAPRPRPRLKRRIRLRKRWMVLVSPLLVLGGLIALAPDAPQQNQVAEDPVSMPEARREGEPFSTSLMMRSMP
ncbi:MAG: hypothetical protein CM15mP77_2040 [Synechococcus sp.]|nr:MAG: hypothetical protein CM15mP77_2040 [Synechococcus sp.]